MLVFWLFISKIFMVFYFFIFKEQQTTFCTGINDDAGTWPSVDMLVHCTPLQALLLAGKEEPSLSIQQHSLFQASHLPSQILTACMFMSFPHWETHTTECSSRESWPCAQSVNLHCLVTIKHYLSPLLREGGGWLFFIWIGLHLSKELR